MVSCCIIQCGSRKDKSQPKLTMHRFPTNKDLRKKWIEAIGIEHINTRPKLRFVCSLHFEEKCFNRTLDVTRLREDAVPSLSYFIQAHQSSKTPTLIDKENETSNKPVIHENIINDKTSTSAISIYTQSPIARKIPYKPRTSKVQKSPNSNKECQELRRKVKSLNECLRRRNKIIKHLKNVVEELRRRLPIQL